jgi:uncharacterized protein
MSNAASPCVKICSLDPATKICTGCGRTLNEIGNWMRMSQAERELVNQQLDERLRKLETAS